MNVSEFLDLPAVRAATGHGKVCPECGEAEVFRPLYAEHASCDACGWEDRHDDFASLSDE